MGDLPAHHWTRNVIEFFQDLEDISETHIREALPERILTVILNLSSLLGMKFLTLVEI